MSEKYVVPDFKLDDYPLNRAEGRLTPLQAKTIYYWEGHYWLAVLKVKSSFGQGESTSVRVYRWQWKKDREGKERWMVDFKATFNKKDIWDKTRDAVESMFK